MIGLKGGSDFLIFSSCGYKRGLRNMCRYWNGISHWILFSTCRKQTQDYLKRLAFHRLGCSKADNCILIMGVNLFVDTQMFSKYKMCERRCQANTLSTVKCNTLNWASNSFCITTTTAVLHFEDTHLCVDHR